MLRLEEIKKQKQRSFFYLESIFKKIVHFSDFLRS